MLPDGRLVIVLRNASPNAKDKGGFCPSIHRLLDDTIVATSYANYPPEDLGCSIVSIRFRMSEVEALAQKP